MARQPLRSAALLLVMTSVALAACGGSGARDTSSSPALPGSSAPPSASGTPADAATRAAVNTAYATFFNTQTSAAASESALQHGATFRATLAAEAGGHDNVTASVSSVRLLRPNVAAVVFTIDSGGSPLLSNSPGYAVRENGRWKVAAQTFCGLLQLQGDAPSACQDPAITGLPN
jgi:hypothetical protein